MELMDISLDKFYRFTHRRLQQKIPESILGKIALAVLDVKISAWNDTHKPNVCNPTDCPSFELFERKSGDYPS